MVAPSRQMVICWLKCTCDKDCNDGGPLRADGDYVGSGSYSSFVPSPFALSTDTLPFLNLFFPPGLAKLPTSMIYNGDRRTTTLHNVHFVKYVFLPTEQAETYLKSCVLINYSTYICLCLFGWKENMILKETVTFKL